MIRFFRKIRQKLFTENKFTKYFFYAIGEIILVVIGILIALQINNNNEIRKNKVKETLILQEILNSINKDFDSSEEFWKPRLERKKEGLDSLSVSIFENRTIPDTLFMDFYNKIKQDLFVRFDNGPFEALKSTGLDIIANDSLRSKINSVYTVSLPLFSHFANQTSQSSESRINQLESKFLKPVLFIHNDNRKHIHFTPKVKNVLKNESFLIAFNIEQKKYREFRDRINQMKIEMNSLKKMIETELNKIQ